VPEPRRQLRVKVGFPVVVSVETDDVIGLFRRRRESEGPFLLIGRDRGLALDTAFQRAEGDVPILWPANAGAHQLWYFHQTEHRDQYLIASVANEFVLDAQISSEMRRQPVMWSRHGESHQRWRLHPVEDAAAFIIESVHTGHVLDIPHEAGPQTKTPPVLWEKHGAMNQQFLIVTPSGGPIKARRKPRG
jgi:hypothetical protein